jgi:hypothetical protein
MLELSILQDQQAIIAHKQALLLLYNMIITKILMLNLIYFKLDRNMNQKHIFLAYSFLLIKGVKNLYIILYI